MGNGVGSCRGMIFSYGYISESQPPGPPWAHPCRRGVLLNVAGVLLDIRIHPSTQSCAAAGEENIISDPENLEDGGLVFLEAGRQLLPKNSVLMHCIRAYAQYRLMIGLHCTTEERITRLRGYIKKYETFCSVSSGGNCASYRTNAKDGRFVDGLYPSRSSKLTAVPVYGTRVATEYGKNFDFPKQHATAHAIDDLREKGLPTTIQLALGKDSVKRSRQCMHRQMAKTKMCSWPVLTRIKKLLL
ncbi:hypothetical protein B0H17DRAFT_1187201 [Mycena rosella]|uniref:Uncharacterized protein n=1 Tax=Mycena rosella TaxID=1033263 RepID=A0AAD7C672_MYCRO|nr:hypothetical protein B0H17DRAFT_1187201 [Mycena rosella]